MCATSVHDVIGSSGSVLVVVVLVVVVLVVVVLVVVVLVVVVLVVVVLVDAGVSPEVDGGTESDVELDDEVVALGPAVDPLATSSLGDEAHALSTTANAMTVRPDVTRGRIRSTSLQRDERTRLQRGRSTHPDGRSRGPSPA